jgi:large subunit ribosomal protein L29
MAIGSKNLSIDALDGYDNERLQEELKKAKAELFTGAGHPSEPG